MDDVDVSESKFRGRIVPSLKPHCLVEYMASMTMQGIPDIYLHHARRSYWLELKFVDEWPKRGSSNVLKKHNFTGAQLTFLGRIDDTGGRGMGVVGFRDGRLWKIVTVRRQNIGDDGTLTLDEFRRHRQLVIDKQTFAARFLELLRRS